MAALASFHTIFQLLHRSFFFFFNDTATTEIYTLSLHDALPIWWMRWVRLPRGAAWISISLSSGSSSLASRTSRSEEHTSELQSRLHLVCRLLLEKKKKKSQCRDMLSTHSAVGMNELRAFIHTRS